MRDGFQQLCRGGAKGIGDLKDVFNRDVALCALDGADIGAMQAGTVGQLLLGDTGRGSEALQVEGQYLLWRSDGDGLAFVVMDNRLGAV